MWPEGVFMTAPFFVEYLGLAERVEDLAVKEFIPGAGVEALAVSVLPR